MRIGETAKIIEVTDLQTPASLAMTVVEVRQFFDEYHLPQPPLPDNVLTLAPCSLLIIETQAAAGRTDARITITNPQGDTLYEREWQLT